VRIGPRRKPKARGACRHLDVGRQHRKALHHVGEAALGRERERHDHEVEAFAAARRDEVVEAAETRISAHLARRAPVSPIVEDAGDADDRVGIGFELGDEFFGHRAGAVDDGALIETAGARCASHVPAGDQPLGEECGCA